MFLHTGLEALVIRSEKQALCNMHQLAESKSQLSISYGLTSGHALYTDEEADTLLYEPYTMSVDYNTLGKFCTIDGHLDKVEGRKDVFYPLPFTPKHYACATAVDTTGVVYIVDTGSIEGQPVLRVTRADGANMVRDEYLNRQVNFTLTYRYK